MRLARAIKFDGPVGKLSDNDRCIRRCTAAGEYLRPRLHPCFTFELTFGVALA